MGQDGQRRRRVTQIGGGGAREIAELQATSAKAAIKRAARERGIDNPHQQEARVLLPPRRAAR